VPAETLAKVRRLLKSIVSKSEEEAHLDIVDYGGWASTAREILAQIDKGKETER